MFALKPILGLRVVNAARSEVEKPWRLDITTTFSLAIQRDQVGPSVSRFFFILKWVPARSHTEILFAHVCPMSRHTPSTCASKTSPFALLSISSFVGMDAWMQVNIHTISHACCIAPISTHNQLLALLKAE